MDLGILIIYITKMAVSVCVSVCPLAIYFLGGILFRAFEGWEYFTSFYFCFITMATIGFGDFVPTEQVI